MKLTAFVALSTVVLGVPLIDGTCTVMPTGIGEPEAQVVADVLKMIEAPFLWLPLAGPLIEKITEYETPIQFRLAAMHGSSVYNVAAMYDPSALDIWGRAPNRVCDNVMNANFDSHMEVAIAYAFAYSGILVAPASAPAITNIMNNVLQLPMSKLDGSPDISTPWGTGQVHCRRVARILRKRWLE
jgi:hypothetical protein